MNLTFDADKHEYRLDGSVVPSVTQILAPLYDFDRIPRDVLDRKRQIGVALDALIELDLKDDLDESSVDPSLEGYFRAWRLFRKEKDFKPLETQKRVVSLKYRYAGTPDAWGYMGNHIALVDWKATYAMHPAVALQTAAYENACHETIAGWLRNPRRYGIKFREDGHYILTPYTKPENKNDFGIFLSFLSCHNWRVKNGLLKEKQP